MTHTFIAVWLLMFGGVPIHVFYDADQCFEVRNQRQVEFPSETYKCTYQITEEIGT